MKFLETELPGAFIIELEPFTDERGMFVRVFCQKELETIGFKKHIVQINHSITRKKGTIRGMHFQIPPVCETKIVRCVRGTVFDVILDLRAGSATFLKWYGTEISKDNLRMVYIPEGFAHGFQTLTEDAELIYHHSEFYSPQFERGLRFDDPMLAIDWPLKTSIQSLRDRSYHFIDHNFEGIVL